MVQSGAERGVIIVCTPQFESGAQVSGPDELARLKVLLLTHIYLTGAQ